MTHSLQHKDKGDDFQGELIENELYLSADNVIGSPFSSF